MQELADEQRRHDLAHSYTITTRVDGHSVEDDPRPLDDPFVRHTIRPCGWRTALSVLFRRCEIDVIVGAHRDQVERVLELDPEYLGAPGSARRAEWNASLQSALSDFVGADE